MTKRIATAAFAAAMAAGPCASPALADGAASTRNIATGIAAIGAAVGIPALNHRKRAKRQEAEESARRQASYKAWFYQQYGYYPTPEQVHDWYVKSYGVAPS